MITFKIKLVDDDMAWVPTRAHDTDAGFDLKVRAFGVDSTLSDLVKEKLGVNPSMTLRPGDTELIKTGVFIELDVGWEAQIRSRSGLALKKNLIVLNSPGTIDADYRGEIGVIIHNIGKEDVVVNVGDKIAQMVIKKVPGVRLSVVKSLSETFRGEGGFGSTGN